MRSRFLRERLSAKLESVFYLPELLLKVRLSIEAVYRAAERPQILCGLGRGERRCCQESVSPRGQAR